MFRFYEILHGMLALASASIFCVYSAGEGENGELKVSFTEVGPTELRAAVFIDRYEGILNSLWGRGFFFWVRG